MVTSRRGVAAVIAIVVAVIGVTVAAAQVTVASSSASVPLAYGFDGSSGWSHGLVKPDVIYFGAGGSLLVRDLTWVSWTHNAAIGRGVRWSDNCGPTCAAGHYAKVPADMSLSRVRQRDGVSYFSRMTLQWTVGGKEYKSSYHWSGGAGPSAPPFWS
jgi:hypothetical protein